MDDNFLAEGGRDNIETPSEWGKHILLDEATNRIEPPRLADQGDPATDDDPARCDAA